MPGGVRPVAIPCGFDDNVITRCTEQVLCRAAAGRRRGPDASCAACRAGRSRNNCNQLQNVALHARSRFRRYRAGPVQLVARDVQLRGANLPTERDSPWRNHAVRRKGGARRRRARRSSRCQERRRARRRDPLLKADHREVERLFGEFERTRSDERRDRARGADLSGLASAHDDRGGDLLSGVPRSDRRHGDCTTRPRSSTRARSTSSRRSSPLGPATITSKRASPCSRR